MAFIDVLWYVTFCTAHISVHPCCTSAPVHPIPVHTITNGTTAHSTALLYLSPCSPDPSQHKHERYNGPQPQHSTAVPLCTVPLPFNRQLFTDVTIFPGQLPGNSVGIATDYGLDGPGIESRWGGIFRPSRPTLGLNQPSVQWVPGLSRR